MRLAGCYILGLKVKLIIAKVINPLDSLDLLVSWIHWIKNEGSK